MKRTPPLSALFLRFTCIGLLIFFGGCGRERPWNVILFTFDTTRADFIGAYGKPDARTPHLDRMAEVGFLFENNYTSNPVTQAAHSTILTGVYPMMHGVRDNTFFHLPDEQVTLAERLSEAGYSTAAAIGGFPLTAEFGTAQGFELYDDDLTAERRDQRGRPVRRSRNTWYDERPAGHVNDAILPWLRDQANDTDSPFFAWLHYWDPHEPHIAPPPYDQLFAHDSYSGEIAYADENLGTILRELENLGELDRTLIIMTADHGEGRLDHRETTHAFLAYDSTIRVPLIIQIPGRQGGMRISERTGTVDIVPTVLDLLELPLSDPLQGRSLAPLMVAQARKGRTMSETRRFYYAESLSPRLSHGFGELRVLFSESHKYIHGPRPELFDLTDDPKELRDLSEIDRDRTHQMRQALQSFVGEHASSAASSAAHEASDETKRQLAALGYLSTSGDAPDSVVEVLRSDGEAPQDHLQDWNSSQRLRGAVDRGQFRLAREIAESLLDSAPDHEFYRAKWVAATLGLGMLEEAALTVEETETISSANSSDFFEVARALVDDTQIARGLTMARRVVEAEETAAARFELAELSKEGGDLARYAQDIERALELEPDYVPARLERASLHIQQEEYQEAESRLREVLREFPTFAPTFLAYGELLEVTQRPEEAENWFARAVRMNPGYCQAHRKRVEILADLDKQDSAVEALAAMRRGCQDPTQVAQAAESLDREGM